VAGLDRARGGVIAAAALALVLFLAYHSTLLPGLDLGDTASFQTAAGSPWITPRHGYPLYFAVGGLFVRTGNRLGLEPAYSLNVASAAAAAVASALSVLVSASISGSALAGLFAAAMLGVSYTFWSQAVIAEVYALHLVFLHASLLTLLFWANRPTLWRLASAFLVYALGFGTHLSMILLLPGMCLFLAMNAPGGFRFLIRPRVVALASLAAAAGFAPYGWNLAGLLAGREDPGTPREALGAFWFDVTKADWRETIVGTVPLSMYGERLAMYWFDLRQQFGVAGVILAGVGLLLLALHQSSRPGDALPARGTRVRPRAVAALLGVDYLVTAAFAFTYNVGDAHVFFMPSHAILAILMAPTVALIPTAPGIVGAALAALTLAYPCWRAFETAPVVDRSQDLRPVTTCERLVSGLSGDTAILGAQVSWQLHNGLEYLGKYGRGVPPVFTLGDQLLSFPFLVADNLTIGREVALTRAAATEVRAAYGDRFLLVPDDRTRPGALEEAVRNLRAGVPYVASLLRARSAPVDPDEVDRIALALGSGPLSTGGAYTVVAGLVGSPPAILRSEDRPFRVKLMLAGLALDIRIESYLAFDTIRRAGFGHVVANRRHAFTIENGFSLAGFDPEGHTTLTGYLGNLHAPEERFLVIPAPGP
jgi:hypothetical protein